MNATNLKHPHHTLWREFMQGIFNGKPKTLERFSTTFEEWVPVAVDSDGMPDSDWNAVDELRLVDPVVTRTITHPKPMSQQPRMGTSYWTIGMAHVSPALEFFWYGDEIDLRRLKRGLCWPTEADTIKSAKAFFGGEA